MLSPIQSRAFSENQSWPERGSTSPPTLLRWPSAATSDRPSSGLTWRYCAVPGDHADVAGRADRNVEPARRLGIRDHVLPAVGGVRREVAVDDLALRVVEIVGDILVAIDLVDVADVEVAVVETDAGRLPQPLDDGLRHPLVALLLQREHVVGPAADIERVVAAEHHLAGAVEVAGQDFDMEARQQLDILF